MSQSVKAKLQLAFVKLFCRPPCTRHVRIQRNSKLPVLQRLVVQPSPVLLIDDVATSGLQPEEVIGNLRQVGVSCIAIVWISGRCWAKERHCSNPRTPRAVGASNLAAKCQADSSVDAVAQYRRIATARPKKNLVAIADRPLYARLDRLNVEKRLGKLRAQMEVQQT